MKWKLKGLSEYCLNQASQFLDENDALYREIHKEKMCWGVRFLHLCRVSKIVTHQHPTQY